MQSGSDASKSPEQKTSVEKGEAKLLKAKQTLDDAKVFSTASLHIFVFVNKAYLSMCPLMKSTILRLNVHVFFFYLYCTCKWYCIELYRG